MGLGAGIKIGAATGDVPAALLGSIGGRLFPYLIDLMAKWQSSGSGAVNIWTKLYRHQKEAEDELPSLSSTGELPANKPMWGTPDNPSILVHISSGVVVAEHLVVQRRGPRGRPAMTNGPCRAPAKCWQALSGRPSLFGGKSSTTGALALARRIVDYERRVDETVCVIYGEGQEAQLKPSSPARLLPAFSSTREWSTHTRGRAGSGASHQCGQLQELSRHVGPCCRSHSGQVHQ